MNEVNESLWVKVVTRESQVVGQSKCGPGHWAKLSEPYEIGKMQQSDSKIEKYALHNDGVIRAYDGPT